MATGTVHRCKGYNGMKCANKLSSVGGYSCTLHPDVNELCSSCAERHQHDAHRPVNRQFPTDIPYGKAMDLLKRIANHKNTPEALLDLALEADTLLFPQVTR